MATIRSDSVMTERVFKWWDYPIFILLSGLSLLAILSFLSHWFSFEDWSVYPVSYSILTVIMLVILTNNQGRWFLLPYMRKPRPMLPSLGWNVAVVTTVVPSAEPIEMLRETVRAMVDLDYAHDTWVLDEEDDERVKALCLELGAKHFSRKNCSKYHGTTDTFRFGSKHGNYNAWLNEIGLERYDILTTFDPDHVPQKSFLMKVLGYFEDARVGYVQVAQAYYNQKASFIASGAAEETYAYYSSIQMADHGMGYPIIVGCHNTHRLTALKQVNGFPAHDAEDLLLTRLYRTAGWQGVYVPEILARGLAPVDWSGYLRQQRRWARSVLDVKFRLYSELSKNLSVQSRVISFLHGLNYLHRSVILFLAIMLTGFMLATGDTPRLVSYDSLEKLGVVCVVLQISEFYRQRFYLDWRNEWGFHWRVALLQYAKWPWFLLALFDVLCRKQKPYVLTAKVKARQRNRLLLLPNMAVILFLCAAFVVGQTLGNVVHPVVSILAVGFVIASVILIWTEFGDFPAPYDREMTKIVGRQEDVQPEFSLRDKQVSKNAVIQEPVGHDAVFLSRLTVPPPNGDGSRAADTERLQLSIRKPEHGED